MSTHDCGGWCAKPGNAAVIAATREGKNRSETARAVGRPLTSVITVVSRARILGCLPGAKPRGTARTKACGWCREDFTYYHSGTHYCSETCSKAARKAGHHVTEKDDPREYGPAEPIIRTDVEGMWRRALAAARDEVCTDAIYERFPHDVAVRAIAQAVSEGRRTPVGGMWSGFGFSRLPFGGPAP